MNKSISAVAIAAVLTLTMVASQAEANSSYHRHHRHAHKGHVVKHHNHYSHLRRGYYRPGPPYGYRFGFSTYAGDPFYSDDYFDGRRCYYLRHRDFCRGPKSLDWLRW
jgi:hypothetical protein